MVSKAIASGDIAAINYFVAEQYITAFGELARSPNQKVLMMPIEATALRGARAGIAEIAKGDVRRWRVRRPSAAGSRPAVGR